MADEIIVPLDAASEIIVPLDGKKPVNITASTPASTEYTDEKGGKVVVSEVELNPENLKTTSIQRIEAVSNLPGLKAKELCQNCRFWNPTEIRQNKDGKSFPINGECRVNAPEIFVRWTDEGNSSSFPMIGPFQWCGKYEKTA